MNHFADFADTLCAFIQAVLERLKVESARASAPLIPQRMLMSSLILEAMSFIPHMTEFAPVLTIVRSDSQLSSSFLVDAGGTPVNSSEQEQAGWLAQAGLGFFLRHYLAIRSDLSWDETTFDEILSHLRFYVEQPTIPVVVTAPLDYFSSTLDTLEIAANFFVHRLSHEEKRQLEQRKITMFGESDLRSWSHVARVQVEQPKHSPQDYSHAFGLINDLVTVLRLHRPELVSSTIVWVEPERPTFEYVGSTSHGGGDWRVHTPPYELTAEAADQVRELFVRYRQTKRELAGTSARRFELAS